MNADTHSKPRPLWLWTLLVCVLSLLGNLCNLPLFFGVDLIFGSIAVMLAIELLGLLPAIAAAVVGGLYTVALWGHPYALVIFTLEALVVGILRRRHTRNLVLADLGFWLVVGVPLIIVFYFQQMGLPWSRTLGIAFKQPINGIFNALAAGLLLIVLQLAWPAAMAGKRPRPRVESILFHSLLGAVLLAGTIPIVLESRSHRQEYERFVAENLGYVADAVVKSSAIDAGSPALEGIDVEYLRAKIDIALIATDGRELARIGELGGLGEQAGMTETMGHGVERWLPLGDMPELLRERESRYRHRRELESGLTLVVEQSAVSVVDAVERERLRQFQVLALLLLLGILASRALSSKLTGPLRALEISNRDIASLASCGKMPVIADSPIHEYHELTAAWREMAGSLADNFSREKRVRSDLERLVRERTAALELVIANTGVGIWDWQVQTGETQFNERWAEIIGYTLEELKPVSINTWVDHAHPEDLVESNRLLEAHWAGEDDRYEFEGRMRHKLGHWVWVLDTGRVVEWARDGKPRRMVGTHIDISRQKAAQRELLKAKEDAESATRARSDFLAMMSHEIRTPFNGVVGMLNLLDTEDLGREQQRRVRLALDSAYSLLTLIDDILDVSKIDAGRLDLEIVPFDLRELFENTVEVLSFRAREKGLELTLNLDAGDCTLVAGDPGRLRQILTNLVGNAIKFTHQGNIGVSARLGAGDQDIMSLQVSVEDTGIGIAGEKLASLFDPFTQVDTSTTRCYGGTGLGLSIVRHLCELMGGAVDVSSEPGRGSRFTFDITLRRVSDEEAGMFRRERAKAVAATADRLLRPEPGGVNPVLVVEDNRVNQEVILGMLAVAGIGADIVNDGQEALHALSARRDAPYAAVLMDCHMPVLDGYETTACVRRGDAGESHRAVPVIAMTANAMQGDRERCLAAGMDDYLSKPVDRKALVDRVEKWLSVRAQVDGVATGGVWNWEGALERMGGQAESLRVVIGLFMEDIPKCLSDMQQAAEAGDLESAALAAHSIKGMAGNVEATELFDVAGQAEAAMRANQHLPLPELLQQLHLVFSEVSGAMTQYLEQQAADRAD